MWQIKLFSFLQCRAILHGTTWLWNKSIFFLNTNFGQRLQWCIAFLLIPALHSAWSKQGWCWMTLRATVSSSCHTGQRSLSSHGRCRVSLTKGGWEGLYKKGGWEQVTVGAGLVRRQLFRRIVGSPKLPMFNLNRAGGFSSKACLCISMKIEFSVSPVL